MNLGFFLAVTVTPAELYCSWPFAGFGIMWMTISPFFALDKRFVYLSKDHSIVKPLESAWMFPMLKYIRQSMIHMEEFTCTGISDMSFRFHSIM